MLNGLIIGSAMVLLVVLIYFERERKPNTLIPTKFLLSLLFVIAALVQPHPILRYYQFLCGGLIFCLVGDVCLALPRKTPFLFGLISFLFAHVMYIFAFLTLATTGYDFLGAVVIVAAVSGSVYGRLFPHLGSLKLTVLCYVLVISIMVVSAWSVMGNMGVPKGARLMIFFGSFSFYVSDMFVARDRFLKREFLNRALGIPLYYNGQFLLAFSVGLVK